MDHLKDTKKDKKILYRPIIIVMLISMSTVILYYICPQEWNNRKDPILLLFLLACNLMLLLGYIFGNVVRFRKPSRNIETVQAKNTANAINLLRLCSKVYLFMFLPDFIYSTRIMGQPIGEIIQRFSYIINDPAKNYAYELSYTNSGSSYESIFVIVDVLASFFFFPIVPLSIILWKKLSKGQKAVFFLFLVVEINKWLLKGMNKGIFDLVIIISISFFVKFAILNSGNNTIINKKAKPKMNKILTILLFVGAITLFTVNFNSRTAGNVNVASYYSPETRVFSDPNNILLKYAPAFLRNTIISFSSYLTQGYEGLGYALKVNFTSTFPFGSSVFLISNFDGVLGLDIWNNTYMVKIDNLYQWDQKVNWHSLYTWFANDVSFFGVPFIMFIIGVIFALVWKDILLRNDFDACIVFILLFILFFYISANNQIMSYAFDFIPFWSFLFMWLFKRWTQN